jgi:hypothetical protein
VRLSADFPDVPLTFTDLLGGAIRSFDFYLGMYSAARSVREHLSDEDFSDGAVVMAASGGGDGWVPFLCLQAILDGTADPAVYDGEELTDFRILIQLTLDRVYDDCRRVGNAYQEVGQELSPTKHRHCAAAIAVLSPPRIAGVEEVTDFTRRRLDDESTPELQLRLLGLYGFHFCDLGRDRDQAGLAHHRWVRLAANMSQQLADSQPNGRVAASVLARMGVDMGIGYLPPLHSLHATIGVGAEFGHSTTVDDPRWDWLRFASAVSFDGLSSLLNPTTNYLALIPKAGLEFELFGRGILQLRSGVRAGYQLSKADGFL